MGKPRERECPELGYEVCGNTRGWSFRASQRQRGSGGTVRGGPSHRDALAEEDWRWTSPAAAGDRGAKSGRGGELGPEAGPPKPRGGPVRSVRGQYRAEARRAEDSDATFSSLAAPSCHQTVHLRKWAERAMLHLAPRGRVPFLPKRDARHLHRLNPHPPLRRFRLPKPATSIAPTPSRIDFPSTIVSSSLPAIHSSRTPRPRRRGSPTRQRRTWYRLRAVFEMHVLSVHLEMHPSLVDRVPLWATRRHQGGHLGSIVCFDYLIGRIFT